MRSGRGFTLIELLVMIVAVGVLCAVLFMHLVPARESARRCSCMSNTRQIGLAMTQYAGEHDDRFPPLVDAGGNTVPAVDNEGRISALPARTAFAVLLKESYLTTTKVFVCPSSRDVYAGDDFPEDYRTARLQDLVLPEKSCSYGWDPTKTFGAYAACAILADNPSKHVSASNEGTAKNNTDNHRKAGQNIWYNDGHVKWATTSTPDAGEDPDIYLGDPGYEKSTTDAKIIR
ncbi:MAG TPA: DUF1559 domain-containing protein [Planctomycetota bacterium]|nr:DUF1559 domain-containing protein [Planctomycetota bacterium]